MTATLNTVTVHPEAYLAGKRACQESLSRSCEPNWPLVRLLGRDFEIGYLAEYDFLTDNDNIPFWEPEVTVNATFRLNNEE